MGKLRYAVALLLGKLSVPALKITCHVGGEFPGYLALKICPDFIGRAKKANKVICVTGTNGKTTTTNMTADMLRRFGNKVESNGDGANLDAGSATVLVRSLSIFNQVKVDAQVIEVDERCSRRLLPLLQPDYLIVTNVMRDSCKRNANPDYIFSFFNEFTPEKTKFILNADDICSSQLRPESPRSFFGIDKLPTDVKEHFNIIADHSFCPVCHSKLEYEYLRFHHIGKVHCPSCGFKSHEADYLVTNIDYDNMTMDIAHEGKTTTIHIASKILFHIYNELGVISFLNTFGFTMEEIANEINAAQVPETRRLEIPAGNATVIKMMAKGQSAVSSCTTLETTSKEEGNKVYILVIDDHEDAHDSVEFIGWIYDVDYEFLAKDNVKQIVHIGPHYADYQMRLRMAGIPEEKILCTPSEDDAMAGLVMEDVDKVYVLFDPGNLPQVDRVFDKAIAKYTDYAKEAAK